MFSVNEFIELKVLTYVCPRRLTLPAKDCYLRNCKTFNFPPLQLDNVPVYTVGDRRQIRCCFISTDCQDVVATVFTLTVTTVTISAGPGVVSCPVVIVTLHFFNTVYLVKSNLQPGSTWPLIRRTPAWGMKVKVCRVLSFSRFITLFSTLRGLCPCRDYLARNALSYCWNYVIY